ncbi:MAG: hypothetical protein R3E32_06300 [Chitinophagales bacterium]
MKKVSISELKQLDNVKEINGSKATDLKGGLGNSSPIAKIVRGIVTHSLGFIPPPGI